MTTSAPSAAGGQPDGQAAPGRRQFRLILGALQLSILLAAIDQTVVATGLPTIVGDLGGFDHLSWVINAYLIASTAAAPLWGKVGDLVGRKLVFQISIVTFLAGSVLCGLARSMPQLIAFRGLQGLSAGGLMALAMAVVADVVPPRERGRIQGYLQAVFVLASVGGPLLGGVVVDHASWRWLFYVNLPVGLVALAVVSKVLTAPARRTRPAIDYLGAGLLPATVVCLSLTAVWGGDRFPWASWQTAGLLAAAAVLAGCLLVVERRAAEPMLPLRMFGNPVFAVSAAVLLLSTCALFAAIVFLPLFLQVVTGATATYSGLLVLPLMLAMAASTTVSGRLITRTGRYKIFPVIGLAAMTAGLFLLSRMDTHTGRLASSAYMVVFGAGFGMVTQVLVLAVQNSVERRDLGTATATVNLVRSLGGSLGVAVFGGVLATRLQHWLPLSVPAGAGPVDAHALQASPAQLHALPPAVRDGVAVAFGHALQGVFMVATPCAAAAFVLVLWLREYPLRGGQQHGQQGGQRQAQDRQQAA